MRRSLILFLISMLLLSLVSPASGAVSSKPGARCTSLGSAIVVGTKMLECIRVNSRLSWSKAMPRPVAPTLGPTYYKPQDPTNVRRITDDEGCAVGFDLNHIQVTFVQLQAQVGAQWLDVKPSEIGFEKRCHDPRRPGNQYYAYANAAVDDGTVLRWRFTGLVDIAYHDPKGHGISMSFVWRAPLTVLQPHPIAGNYGISWNNINDRINDISAAAWTDAQSTIKRNEGHPSALEGFSYFLSPGAVANEPRLEDAVDYLKRLFMLLGKLPHAQKTIFIALTHSERTSVEVLIDKMTPQSQLLKDNIDSMFGIKPTEPAGSIYTAPDCSKGGPGRANNSYPQTRDLSFIVIGVCPPTPTQDPYKAATRGVPHEYVHTIQNMFADGVTAMRATPCWMREGQAEWGQAVTAKTFEDYLSRQSFHPFYLTSTGLNGQISNTSSWTANEVQKYLISSSNTATCAETNEYALSASIGHAAIEALASIGGTESVFALNSHLGFGRTLDQAFRSVYGISWDAALPILSAVISKKIMLSGTSQALTYQTRPAN